MTDFKVGDEVRVVKEYDNVKVGMVGKICKVSFGHPPIGVDFGVYNDGFHSCDNTCQSGNGYFLPEDCIEKTTKRKNTKIKPYRFAVVWEEDRDPIKFFYTPKGVKTFIDELIKKPSVKKNSIQVLELKSIKRVEVKQVYSLK